MRQLIRLLLMNRVELTMVSHHVDMPEQRHGAACRDLPVHSVHEFSICLSRLRPYGPGQQLMALYL